MLYDLKEANNKTVETYTRVVSEPGSSNKKDYGVKKRKFKNKKHTERRKKTRKDIRAMKTESNRKYMNRHKERLQSRSYKRSGKSTLSWIKICPFAYNKRNRIKKTTPYGLQRFC